MLHSRKLLTYNFATHKWDFTLSQIEETTNVSDNVLDVLKARIGELHKQVQAHLIVASYLGFMVDTALLEVLMDDLGTIDDFVECAYSDGQTKTTKETICTDDALKFAKDEGLFEFTAQSGG
ncbi:MAG: hypothetical protein SGARI_005507, partial [Bacillariaceae sp.]